MDESTAHMLTTSWFYPATRTSIQQETASAFILAKHIQLDYTKQLNPKPFKKTQTMLFTMHTAEHSTKL